MKLPAASRPIAACMLLAVAFVAWLEAQPAGVNYRTPTLWTIGGNMNVSSGSAVDFKAGSALKVAGVDRTAALATAPAAVASGYKIARGEVTLDGSNPTPAATGLATVVACTVRQKTASTPGLDPTTFTEDYGGGVTAGTVNFYAWKVTSNLDNTLVASTNSSAVLSWICIGT